MRVGPPAGTKEELDNGSAVTTTSTEVINIMRATGALGSDVYNGGALVSPHQWLSNQPGCLLSLEFCAAFRAISQWLCDAQ